MSTYDFDKLTERRNTNSVKWDEAEDSQVIPMWVADMDFRSPKEVIDSLVSVSQNGVFGYSEADESYLFVSCAFSPKFTSTILR